MKHSSSAPRKEASVAPGRRSRVPAAVWVIAAAAALALLGLALFFCLRSCGEGKEPIGNDTQEGDNTMPDTTPAFFEPLSLGGGLTLTHFGPYAGLYVENGSDVIVSSVASVIVENTGTDCVQLMHFTMHAANGDDYSFELSTLLPGQQMVVLEKTGAPCGPQTGAQTFTAEITAYAVFPEPPSLHEDTLSLTVRGKSVTVKNISDTTVPAGRIFYKNANNGLFVGGITYMLSFGALEPGAEVTLFTNHLDDETSRIMFVTYGE